MEKGFAKFCRLLSCENFERLLVLSDVRQIGIFVRGHCLANVHIPTGIQPIRKHLEDA